MKMMKIKQILQSLMLVFLLIGFMFPIDASKFSYESGEFGVVTIDINKQTFFSNLFAISVTPSVVSPGQPYTVRIALNNPESLPAGRYPSFGRVQINRGNAEVFGKSFSDSDLICFGCEFDVVLTLTASNI